MDGQDISDALIERFTGLTRTFFQGRAEKQGVNKRDLRDLANWPSLLDAMWGYARVNSQRFSVIDLDEKSMNLLRGIFVEEHRKFVQDSVPGKSVASGKTKEALYLEVKLRFSPYYIWIQENLSRAARIDRDSYKSYPNKQHLFPGRNRPLFQACVSCGKERWNDALWANSQLYIDVDDGPEMQWCTKCLVSANKLRHELTQKYPVGVVNDVFNTWYSEKEWVDLWNMRKDLPMNDV